MGLKVIHRFYDAQDNRHLYQRGDVFPHAGLEVSEERIAELAGCDNALGMPLIAEEETKKTRKKKA